MPGAKFAFYFGMTTKAPAEIIENQELSKFSAVTVVLPQAPSSEPYAWQPYSAASGVKRLLAFECNEELLPKVCPYTYFKGYAVLMQCSLKGDTVSIAMFCSTVVQGFHWWRLMDEYINYDKLRKWAAAGNSARQTDLNEAFPIRETLSRQIKELEARSTNDADFEHFGVGRVYIRPSMVKSVSILSI
jgi:hypothetical protein